MGRKHCGKRRNCSSRAISPFPTVFFNRLVLHTRKNQGLFGKGLNGSQNIKFVSNKVENIAQQEGNDGPGSLT